MQLVIRTFEADPITIEAHNGATVGDLKTLLGARIGLPIVDQIVSVNGAELNDDSMMLAGDLGMSDMSAVDVSARLLGGKVHGSLARAGKVRGQTPKVDKQEKKKKKVGRAKRRMQYNRRFVNVALGPGGRRRGPNSNAPAS